jgi:D-sedoheptulose 7-phosphate isomerase
MRVIKSRQENVKKWAMNKLGLKVSEDQKMKEFCENYFRHLSDLLKSLDLEKIAAFSGALEEARQNDNTVFFIGNGGSAATASHMANDFGANINKNDDEAPSFRALSLTDNSAIMSAIANDDGYQKLFVNQLRIHYRPGDKLVAISASGNSPNVVTAAQWVKKRGGTVISLTGFDGGKLKEISDIAIHVETQKGEYGPVEDVHMIMDHLIVTWFQQKR